MSPRSEELPRMTDSLRWESERTRRLTAESLAASEELRARSDGLLLELYQGLRALWVTMGQSRRLRVP